MHLVITVRNSTIKSWLHMKFLLVHPVFLVMMFRSQNNDQNADHSLIKALLLELILFSLTYEILRFICNEKFEEMVNKIIIRSCLNNITERIPLKRIR